MNIAVFKSRRIVRVFELLSAKVAIVLAVALLCFAVSSCQSAGPNVNTNLTANANTSPIVTNSNATAVKRLTVASFSAPSLRNVIASLAIYWIDA